MNPGEVCVSTAELLREREGAERGSSWEKDTPSGAMDNLVISLVHSRPKRGKRYG